MSDESSVRYLSSAWIGELSREVADSGTLAELATEHRIGVTQEVTDGPEGTVIYHLQVGDGAATFGVGPAYPETVKMSQAWDTAVGVATGTIDAKDAFVNGKISLVGGQQELVAAQPVFAALETVFAAVRERTRYE